MLTKIHLLNRVPEYDCPTAEKKPMHFGWDRFSEYILYIYFMSETLHKSPNSVHTLISSFFSSF